MRRLCALVVTAALGAALFVSVAAAQQPVVPMWVDVFGKNQTTRSGEAGAFPISEQSKDRDFPLITQMFSGQNVNQGTAYQMTVAVPLLQFTRSEIMLTWAVAPADTDSVRIAVRVYGATSSTSGNWHLWTPMTRYDVPRYSGDFFTDSCVTPASVAAQDSGGGFGRCAKPVSFWVMRNDAAANWIRPKINASLTSLYQGTALTANTSVNIRKVPTWSVRWASANSVILNLTDEGGAPCPFPYIRIEAFNASGRGLGANTGHITNLEANLWTRVH